ncbi:MAG: MbcA/ParS/Xre antitoxin family protein [Rudanella sp.]|nr:MbcA/ParS/Xre antitoxin family protein [Rudanella sp.]
MAASSQTSIVALGSILTHQDIIRQRRAGVTRSAVLPIKRQARLTDAEMARVLGLSTRTLHSKSADELLSPEAGERLLLLKKLLQHGMTVFEDSAMLANWLRTPLAELAIPTNTPTPFTPRPLAEMGQLDRPYRLAGIQVGNFPQLDLGEVAAPQSPLDVLDTISGFELVDQVLGRIEWGIYS